MWGTLGKRNEIDMRLLVVALWFALGFAVGGVSGKWQGSFRVNGGDHDVPQLLIFNEDGNKLTGTGGPDATERYPISEWTSEPRPHHFRAYDRRLEILL